MASELEKMSTVHKTDTGIDVLVRGDVEKESIETMISGCATGTHACCGPDFFAKVNSIGVSGKDGDVAIHIEGPEVTEEMIQRNLAACDCYQP